LHVRIGKQRGKQLLRLAVDHAPHRFTMHALYQTLCHRLPIGNKRTHTVRIEHEMQHIARPLARSHIEEAIEKARRGFIGHQYVPVPVHDDCRKRLVLTQDAPQRFGDALHLLRVPGRLRIHRRISRRQ